MSDMKSDELVEKVLASPDALGKLSDALAIHLTKDRNFLDAVQKHNRRPISFLATECGEPFAQSTFNSLTSIFEKEGIEDGHGMRDVREYHFANQEAKFEIWENIRGHHVFIFADPENAVAGNERSLRLEDVLAGLEEAGISCEVPKDLPMDSYVNMNVPYAVPTNVEMLKDAVDAAHRSGAYDITVVVPAYPNARQDKRVSREGVSSARFARELEDAGATHVFTLDVHNRAIEGYFRKACFENLHASRNIMDYIKKYFLGGASFAERHTSASDFDDSFVKENCVVVSPDVGALGRANYYASHLGMGLAAIHKQRDYSKPGQVENAYLLGDVTDGPNLEGIVTEIKTLLEEETEDHKEILEIIKNLVNIDYKGKDVFLVDDMIGTGGSVVKAAKLLKARGAGRVIAVCSLPLFSPPAVHTMREAYNSEIIEGIVGTNAVYQGEEKFLKDNPWYHEVLVDRYVARSIFNLWASRSIRELASHEPTKPTDAVF